MSNPHARNNDLNLLHPTVREAVIKIEKALNDEGIPFKPTCLPKAAQSQEESSRMRNLGTLIINMAWLLISFFLRTASGVGTIVQMEGKNGGEECTS